MQRRHRSVLALGAAAGFALALAGLYSGSNPDTFGHLAQGRQILALGHVPMDDTFSLFEPARPFVNYEWLSDLVFAVCDRAFGYDGLLGLKLVVPALRMRLSDRPHVLGIALAALTLFSRLGPPGHAGSTRLSWRVIPSARASRLTGPPSSRTRWPTSSTRATARSLRGCCARSHSPARTR